jgi:hypothetical protein
MTVCIQHSNIRKETATMLMRRSGSFQPTAPPRSEDSLSSFSSSSSRKRARRTKRRPQKVNAWAFVIRTLIVIVAFLSVFDFVLFWKSRLAKHSSIEEEEYHHQKNREPPLLVKDNQLGSEETFFYGSNDSIWDGGASIGWNDLTGCTRRNVFWI